LVHKHLEKSLAFYGPRKGLLLFRKHAVQYLKLQRLPRATRSKILVQDQVDDFLALLEDTYAGLD
jgi:hypothetical protein